MDTVIFINTEEIVRTNSYGKVTKVQYFFQEIFFLRFVFGAVEKILMYS